jgi:hypothetical protein
VECSSEICELWRPDTHNILSTSSLLSNIQRDRSSAISSSSTLSFNRFIIETNEERETTDGKINSLKRPIIIDIKRRRRVDPPAEQREQEEKKANWRTQENEENPPERRMKIS